MGRKYSIRNQEEFYFGTFTVINWVDVFIRNEYKDIFVSLIKYCQAQKGLLVGAWCIMTSHVHLIIGTKGENKLEHIIRDLKSFTSRHIRKEIESNPQESRKEWMLRMMENKGISNSNNNDFQFWIQNNQPIELNDNERLTTRINYVYNNPVEAGFVSNPSEWKYSSAIDYEGGKGLINLFMLD